MGAFLSPGVFNVAIDFTFHIPPIKCHACPEENGVVALVDIVGTWGGTRLKHISLHPWL